MGYLNKEIIAEWLEYGKKKNSTHMIVSCDKWDYSYKPHFVTPGQEVDSVLNEILKYQSGGMISISGIYNYDLDLEEQLKEIYPYHKEPSKRFITMYDKALEYATKKHAGKYRKGSDKKPYIIHPIEVSNLIEKYMKEDSEIEIYKVAALLHDTLEDSNATYKEEKELFGKDIADIVLSLTSDKTKQKEMGKDVYLSKKMCDMNDKTLILKLCDRLDNVSGLDVVDESFNEKYIRETIFIINYLLLNKELNDTHLKIIGDIMKKVKEVSYKDPMIIKPRKLLLEENK